MALNYWQIAGIVGYLLVHLIPIVAADPYRTLARTPYGFRTVGLFALAVALLWLMDSLGASAIFVGVAGSFVLIFFFVLWSVHRAQDCGWSRWLCLLLAFPPAGYLFWAVLLFKPTRLDPGDIDIGALYG